MGLGKVIKSTWRNVKHASSRKVDINANGLIEAMYYKTYASVLHEVAALKYATESVRFITTVNRLELMIAGEMLCPNHKLDELDWMPHMNYPAGLIQWIKQEYIENGSEFTINLSSRARKTVLKSGSPLQVYRRLEFCRNNIAKMLSGDTADWGSTVPYIKQLWTLNTKLGGTGNDDVAAKIRKAIDSRVPPLAPGDRMR